MMKVKLIWVKLQNYTCKFFGTKLPIKFQNWGKNTLHSSFFNFFTHHPLLHHHHIKENKYISPPNILVRDESTEDDALKSQKINCTGHFCSKKFYMDIFTHS